MTLLKPTSGPGVGLSFANQDVTVWNRSGGTLVPGDIQMFDLADTQTETTTTLNEGDDASTFSNVITPTTAGIGVASGHAGYFFGVVITGGADNTKVQIRVRGPCKAALDNSAVTIGAMLMAANTVKTLTLATTTIGLKRLGIAREANASTAGVFEILFDGINGFGNVYAN